MGQERSEIFLSRWARAASRDLRWLGLVALARSLVMRVRESWRSLTDWSRSCCAGDLSAWPEGAFWGSADSATWASTSLLSQPLAIAVIFA